MKMKGHYALLNLASEWLLTGNGCYPSDNEGTEMA